MKLIFPASILLAFLMGCSATPLPKYAVLVSKPVRSGTKSFKEVRLGWKASPSENVSQYMMLSGFAPRTYSITNFTVGVETNMTLVANTVPTYYTVVAMSSFGDESPWSNEVVWPIPRTNVVLATLWSSNMVDWAEIRRETNDFQGDIGFWRLKIE